MFPQFKLKPTIDSLTQNFKVLVEALENVAADHTAKSVEAAERAKDLDSLAKFHASESDRAWKIKSKVEALLK